MSAIELLLQELDHEAQATRRVLEASQKIAWAGSRTTGRCLSVSWGCTWQ